MTKPARRSRVSKASSQKSDVLRRVTSLIRRGKRFLVATHVSPDGDALGSALALAAGLRRLGKSVKVYNADPVPASLRFLPGKEKVTTDLDVGRAFDAAFVVDCSSVARVGEAFCGRLRSGGLGPVIILDHHARGQASGDLRVVDSKAASSGVVVHRVLKALGVKMTPPIATNLYVTLVTDTGNFRYANTSAEVLDLAADLVRAGANPDRISRATNETVPPARLKLLARALDTLELFHQDLIGVMTVTQAMLQEAGGTLEMMEDFVDYPRSLGSVEVSVFLREAPEGWRVSLRSKERIDVGAVAVQLGGGGHVRAAGFTISGSLESAKEKTLARLKDAIDKSSIYKRKSAC